MREEWEEGIVKKFETNMYPLQYLKWLTNEVLLYSTWTLLNVMRQPTLERSLWENGYMYMYDRVPLLSTWNYHNIVNQLYSNIK